MQSYRCFLLLHAATVGVGIIEAESDLEATERAEAVVLDSGNKFDGYELWDGTRQVKRVQGIHREWDDTKGADPSLANEGGRTARGGGGLRQPGVPRLLFAHRRNLRSARQQHRGAARSP